MNALALALNDDGPWDFGGEAARFSAGKTDPFRVPVPQVSEPTTSSEPIWLKPTLARFAELAALRDNWDGRGSAKVRTDVLSFALRSVLPEVLPPTAPAPAVIPLGHGGVQLIWNTASAEIEVEVIAPNKIIACHFDKASGKEVDEPLTNNFSKLADLLWSTFKD